MGNFADYNSHTEEMITWLLARWEEDEVLARARSRPLLPLTLFNAWSQRDAVNDYRTAAARVFARCGALPKLWEVAARFHAFRLRIAVGAYLDREGFNPAWKRAPARR